MQVINPEVFRFFKTLEKNNTREWFEPQKPHFKALEAEANEMKNLLAKILKTFPQRPYGEFTN